MKSVDIVGVLRKDTVLKNASEKDTSHEEVDQDDFSQPVSAKPPPAEGEQPKAEPVKPEQPAQVEEEDTFNYGNSADAIIDLMDTAQKTIFILIGANKIKKSIPKKVLAKMESLDWREMNGEKLTPEEDKLLKRYKEYALRTERMMKSVPFTEDERKDLMACTTSAAKEGKIQISPGMWMFAKSMTVISKRVINLFVDTNG